MRPHIQRPFPRPEIPEEDQPSTKRGFSLKQTFSALQYYNYRLWFAGQLVSLVGTWMQSTAQGFLIYELTHSPLFLGYVGFAAGAPTWIFTLLGGVVADRVPRRTLLVLTQSFMMVLAAILAVLAFTHLVQPWHILVLAFLLGLANAFDAPARQAFVLEMVDRKDLTNAIALNSTMFNSATAVGPAVAGITYAAFGPAWCFTINSVSFVAVIVALLFMKLKPWVAPTIKRNAIEEMLNGLKFVWSQPMIRVLIAGIGIVSLFGMGFVTLFPAWAVEVLGGDVKTNGLLQSARGFGAVTGALMIASLGPTFKRGKLLTIGSLVFPAMLIIYSTIRVLPLSLAVLVLIGWAFMIIANLANALVQTHVPDELRGRVMSIFTLSFFGLFPVGALIAGQTASILGEPATVVLSGTLLLVFAVFAYLKIPALRQMK